MSVKLLKGKHFTFVLHISSVLLIIIKCRHNIYLNNVDALTTCCIQKKCYFKQLVYTKNTTMCYLFNYSRTAIFSPLYFFLSFIRNKYNLFFAIATLILTSAVNFANFLLIIVIISAISFSWKQLALWLTKHICLTESKYEMNETLKNIDLCYISKL